MICNSSWCSLQAISLADNDMSKVDKLTDLIFTCPQQDGEGVQRHKEQGARTASRTAGKIRTAYLSVIFQFRFKNEKWTGYLYLAQQSVLEVENREQAPSAKSGQSGEGITIIVFFF